MNRITLGTDQEITCTHRMLEVKTAQKHTTYSTINVHMKTEHFPESILLAQ